MGLDEKRLWCLTGREYEALRKVHEASVLRLHSMYAAIQATLHNAHFKHPAGESGRFQMDAFMPGGSKRAATAEEKAIEQAAMFSAHMEAAADLKRQAPGGLANVPVPQAVLDLRAARQRERGKSNGG